MSLLGFVISIAAILVSKKQANHCQTLREEPREATGEGWESGQLLCRQKTPIPAKVSASPEIAGSSGDWAQPGIIELSGIGDRLHMSADKSRITVAKLPRPRQARLGTLGTWRGAPPAFVLTGVGESNGFASPHPPRKKRVR